MKRHTVGAVVFTAALSTVSLCMPRVKAAATVTPPAERTAAPAFLATTSRGASITLSQYRGRVLLLDFWATWCTGCKVEIPWYSEFDAKYKTRGYASIGVAMDDEGWSMVRPYLETHPIPYPIVIPTPQMAKDYPITNMPLTLLIDRQGRVADSHVGLVEKGAWEAEIQALLRESAAR